MRSRTCCSPTLQDTDGERGCASVASDPRVATFTFSVPQGLLPDLGFGVRVPRRLRVRVLRWPFGLELRLFDPTRPGAVYVVNVGTGGVV